MNGIQRATRQASERAKTKVRRSVGASRTANLAGKTTRQISFIRCLDVSFLIIEL